MKSNYYTIATREMLAAVKEVGAMPFVLFLYYLTWQKARLGIKPPLKRVCADLNLEKGAVCNLRSRLVKAGWIRYENGEVFILKEFTKNEWRSQNVNGTDFAKLGSIKELKRESKLPQEISSNSESEPTSIYREFFPDQILTDSQKKIIQTRISDSAFWREALCFWAGNGYRAQSLIKICDKYDELRAETRKPEKVNLPTLVEVKKQREEQRKQFLRSAQPYV